ncbi:hypothetical protein [Luteimonas vadosa]|uniref:Uncharacterized protein n=1 Tax=Luteimonas vadosa TaxID=1165507 RepID=A0ABP9DT51_9GAMM
MLMLSRLVRNCCLLAGAIGAVACLWALVDPSILPVFVERDAFAPPSPRWRAALGLVFSLALLGYGTGVLRHRELP